MTTDERIALELARSPEWPAERVAKIARILRADVKEAA